MQVNGSSAVVHPADLLTRGETDEAKVRGALAHYGRIERQLRADHSREDAVAQLDRDIARMQREDSRMALAIPLALDADGHVVAWVIV